MALGTQLKLARVERNGVMQNRGIEIRSGEQITGVRIILHYGNASLRGTVVFENGPLPPGARVFMMLRRLSDDANAPIITQARLHVDARGQFNAEDLVPGTYEVMAGVHVPQERRNITSKRQQVVVTAGSPNTVSITLDLSPPAPKP